MCENACGKLPSNRWRSDIVFLREQADVVAQADQLIEQALRVSRAPAEDISVGKPEAGRKERAFAGRQAVLGRGSVIAEHKSAAQEPCARSPRRCLGRAASSAGKKPTWGISSALASNKSLSYAWAKAPRSVLNARRQTSSWISARMPPPMVERTVEPERFDALDSPVEGNPRHHLRMGEVTALSAHLPDAIVGSSPHGFEMPKQ